MADRANPLLGAAIDPTVTVYINELHGMDDRTRPTVIDNWRDDAIGLVAVHDNPALYRAKTKAQIARYFDRLARGLAAAAWQPGGATFAGYHWCTEPHPDCPNKPDTE